VLPILTSTPTKAKAYSSGVVDLMFSITTIKDEHANVVVEIDMEEGISIPVQPKSIFATAPSLVLVIEDSKVEEIEAIVMEN
jgi:hypothetical protein